MNLKEKSGWNNYTRYSTCTNKAPKHIRSFSIHIICMIIHSVIFDSLRPHGLYPPRSSVYGILQARILQSVAIPFSRRSSPPRDWTQVSCCLLHWQMESLTPSPVLHHIEASFWIHCQFKSVSFFQSHCCC